jgi:hypothetical protein
MFCHATKRIARPSWLCTRTQNSDDSLTCSRDAKSPLSALSLPGDGAVSSTVGIEGNLNKRLLLSLSFSLPEDRRELDAGSKLAGSAEGKVDDIREGGVSASVSRDWASVSDVLVKEVRKEGLGIWGARADCRRERFAEGFTEGLAEAVEDVAAGGQSEGVRRKASLCGSPSETGFREPFSAPSVFSSPFE